MTIAQGAQTFAVAPGTANIYQGFDDPDKIHSLSGWQHFYPPGYSVAWSLSDPSGNSGTIDALAGLYHHPRGHPIISGL